jgi:parallel beta-helix repeat protein
MYNLKIKKEKKAVSKVITSVLLVLICILALIILYNVLMAFVRGVSIGERFDDFLNRLSGGEITSLAITNPANCFIGIEIESRNTDSGPEFSIINITNFYGEYNLLINDYNESLPYILRIHNSSGHIIDYSFISSEYFYYDSFQEYNNYSFILIPYQDISRIEAGNSGELQELSFEEDDIWCEKYCVMPGEKLNAQKEFCCFYYTPSRKDDGSLTCTLCGNGICEADENYKSCFEDCYSQLDCKETEVASEYGCMPFVVVKDGLIRYYAFESGFQDYVKESILLGNCNFTYEGVGSAVYFDKKCYVEDEVTLDNRYSISLWTKLNSSYKGEEQVVYSDNHFSLYVKEGRIFVKGICSNGQEANISGFNISDGNWHHLVFSFGTQGFDFYVDTFKYSYDGLCSSGLVDYYVLGADKSDSGYGSYYNGFIDEVMFFNKSINQSEVNLIFEGLVDYFPWYYNYVSPLQGIYYSVCEDRNCNEVRRNFKVGSEAYIKAFNTQGTELYGVVSFPDGSYKNLTFVNAVSSIKMNQLGEYKFDIIAYKKGYDTHRVFFRAYTSENISTTGTEISSCRIINEPGDYVLTRDINMFSNASSRACIDIQARNVQIDCQGHSISGKENIAGIYSNQAYTKIKNCHIGIYDGGIGIKLENADYSDILNNNLSGYSIIQVPSSQSIGLNIYDTDYSEIKGNIFNYNSYGGMHITNSHNNLLKDNTANSNGGYGIYLITSNYNTLEDNTADGNWDYDSSGIAFTNSSFNTLRRNTANSNTQHGITLHFNSNNNVVEDNSAYNNAKDSNYDRDFDCSVSSRNYGSGNDFGSIRKCTDGWP